MENLKFTTTPILGFCHGPTLRLQIGSSRQDTGNLLTLSPVRVLSNHHMQWRFANAKAESVICAQKQEVEEKVFFARCKDTEFNKTEKVEEVAPEIMAAANDVQAKKEIYAPYNILPLDSAGAKQSIMQLEEQLVGVISITEVWLQRCNRQIRGSDDCTDHRPFKGLFIWFVAGSNFYFCGCCNLAEKLRAFNAGKICDIR
ncbi:hypothetical protein CASFOL_028526 [Castilleja foliolosa]|uniref:Uncharacterized protein n=1 Tax=Castilleja foliolosa TaxID=1961234 RepID=A0ABD3CBD1_9LAMI